MESPACSPPVASPRGLRLRSLAELGPALSSLDRAAPPDPPHDPPAVADLLARLAAAEADLAAASAADATARSAAEDLLARHDLARRHTRQAGEALMRAETLLARATELRRHAFTPDAQGAAGRTRRAARRLVDAASAARDHAVAEERVLARHPQVLRLLADRREREEAARAEAERAERRSRLLRALDDARALADRHHWEEACALLEPLAREVPAERPLHLFVARLRERARLAQVARAHATLEEIRRHLRDRPAEVLVAVEGIGLADLDDALARHLFGEWLRAIDLLALPGALRHSPEPHRGALLVPGPRAGTLVVVSAVGGHPLTKGQVVACRDLPGLRPIPPGRR